MAGARLAGAGGWAGREATSGVDVGRRGPSGAGAGRLAAAGAGLLLAEERRDREQRVVAAVGDALLERDERVVGDVDVLGAHLGAALGDVAVAQAVVVDGHLAAVDGVERVHVQLGDPHEEARTGERGLVLLVVTHRVAGVVAQEALDALAEQHLPRGA